MTDEPLIAQCLDYQVTHKQIIKQVSLSLPCGELVAIIGPNGAGKSTLLRLLTGYLVPTHGKCLLAGKSLQEWPIEQLAKHRAVMLQHQQIRFPFTVQEVIAMGRSLYLQGNTAPSAKEKSLHSQHRQAIEAAIDATELQSLIHHPYAQLSGGEKQRVQLARCLAQIWHADPIPCWLFLDEPTSALDLYQQQRILRQLKRLTRQRPLSVCCILHDLNLAALYADKLYLLHQGELVATGSATDVLTQQIIKKWYQAETIIGQHPELSTIPHVYLQH